MKSRICCIPICRTPTDLRGRPVPKLLEMQYTGNALDDITDTLWVRMATEVHAQHRHFVYNGREYTAPHDGAFRFGLVPRPTKLRLSVAGSGSGRR